MPFATSITIYKSRQILFYKIGAVLDPASAFCSCEVTLKKSSSGISYIMILPLEKVKNTMMEIASRPWRGSINITTLYNMR